MHVISANDLKKFQIENYTELLKNSKSEKQIKFLEQQIKLLHGKDENINSDRVVFRYRGNNNISERITQMQEGIEGRIRDQRF